MTIDKELQGLLDPTLTNEQILDNIEKALLNRDAIINSETATEEEKIKAKSEKVRIEQILVNAVRFKQDEQKKREVAKLEKEKIAKIKKVKRKIVKQARKINRK